MVVGGACACDSFGRRGAGAERLACASTPGFPFPSLHHHASTTTTTTHLTQTPPLEHCPSRLSAFQCHSHRKNNFRPQYTARPIQTPRGHTHPQTPTPTPTHTHTHKHAHLTTPHSYLTPASSHLLPLTSFLLFYSPPPGRGANRGKLEFARYQLFKFCWHCGTELTTGQPGTCSSPAEATDASSHNYHLHNHHLSHQLVDMKAAEVSRERFAINKSYSIELRQK
ncbi:hypothetical protein E2C01_048465 [Portunus trituberculatus]|uniref:Uncharacterized protein n=1 Tax=Portunus trituberculatus TaxID=210409 RepID=A0A5B7GDG1_PORTR|nr:hypothetical protein [Portunus trituberculatus]